jgi:hypothetical protein
VLGWSLELAAAENAARQRLSASVRCLRLSLPVGVTGVRLAASTRFEPDLAVPAGGTQRVALRCGAGYIPTGYGLDTLAGRVGTAAAVPGPRGCSVRLANSSSTETRVTVSIRCTRALIRGRRSGASVSLRLETRRASFTNTAIPGEALRHSCRAEEFSVATGASVDQASGLEVASTQPAGARGGLWTFTGTGTVETHLLCLARGSTFR